MMSKSFFWEIGKKLKLIIFSWQVILSQQVEQKIQSMIPWSSFF